LKIDTGTFFLKGSADMFMTYMGQITNF